MITLSTVLDWLVFAGKGLVLIWLLGLCWLAGRLTVAWWDIQMEDIEDDWIERYIAEENSRRLAKQNRTKLGD